MEKICIAKLRRSMTYPGHPDEAFGHENRAGEEKRSTGCSFAAFDGSGSAESRAAAAEGETVSLPLTREQMNKLQSNQRLAALLMGARAEGAAVMHHRDAPVIIKFEFEPMPPVRLLKVEEVLQMLRISKGSLNRIIREGQLKSYKFGRLRRIMLGDVLSYLEDHREVPAAGARTSEPKPAAAVCMQQSRIKEE